MLSFQVWRAYKLEESRGTNGIVKTRRESNNTGVLPDHEQQHGEERFRVAQSNPLPYGCGDNPTSPLTAIILLPQCCLHDVYTQIS